RSGIINGLTDRWISSNRDRWQPYLKLSSDDRWYQRGVNSWIYGIKDMVNATITRIKLQGYSLQEQERIQQRVVSGDDSFIKWTFEIMTEYDRYIRNMGRVDFDDLIVFAYRLLLDDMELRQRMQDRWAYVFEDEAQDSTPLQEKLVRILSEKSGNLLRVGDINQGIMGFTGTDPSLFSRFCSEATNQPISIASRSTQDIMDLANHFVGWVRESFPLEACRNALANQQIRGTYDDDPSPNPVVDDFALTVHEYDSGEEELNTVAHKASVAAKMFPHKTIAILTRDNWSLNGLANCLTERKVPWEDASRGTTTDQQSLEDVQAIVSFLAESDNGIRFRQLVERLMTDLDPDELELLDNYLKNLNPEDLLYPIGGVEIGSIPEELWASGSWKRVEELLADLRRWLEYSHLPADELILQLAGEMALDKEQRELVNSYAGQIFRLLRDGAHHDLSSVIQAQELDRNMKLVIRNLRDRKGYSPQPGTVSLSTMHRSKGLEWDIVYLAGLAIDHFPDSLSQRFPGDIWSVKEEFRNPSALALAQLNAAKAGTGLDLGEIAAKARIQEISENLRVIYVAITRARERLIISSHKKNAYDKVLEPSSIFTEIAAYVKQNVK
ncbi:MAG: ATP-dependent helicase, partial [Syntrophomonadaceae bacterium]|nr:ATP-dependent helicase [Syntrophomonadaceae bacterium]